MKTTREEIIRDAKEFLEKKQIAEIGGRSGFLFSNGNGVIAHIEDHRDKFELRINKVGEEEFEWIVIECVDRYSGDQPIYDRKFHERFDTSENAAFIKHTERYRAFVWKRMEEFK